MIRWESLDGMRLQDQKTKNYEEELSDLGIVCKVRVFS